MAFFVADEAGKDVSECTGRVVFAAKPQDRRTRYGQNIQRHVMQEYSVFQAPSQLGIDDSAWWNSESWREVPHLDLAFYMGDLPAHFPSVQVKLLHHLDELYVHFRVADRYVRALARHPQDPVCCDSCVEFFFTPGERIEDGYFNLEINCGGTILMHYQRVARVDSRPLALGDLKQIKVAHSLPRIVSPERQELVTWFVCCAIPVSILGAYFPSDIKLPLSGTVWRANFFKCADLSSHPHWLTWSKVNYPTPDFHRPEDFGRLRFESS